VQAGLTSYEVDLFGRVRNLSKVALEHYLATEEARKGTQLT
jgi:multidrug efflux system outer membrane protein